MLSKTYLRVAALALALFALTAPANADVLRMGGTGATNGMLKRVGDVFKTESGTDLEIIPSLGTSGGNKAVADGLIDISVAGRALNAQERAKGLKEIPAIRTPFGLATSHTNPNGLNSATIAAHYQSDNPAWPDGTPIRIILRPISESDTAVLGAMFPGMTAAIAKVRARPDLSLAATDQDNGDLAEKTPSSLVGMTLTQAQMEKRKLRFVAIDGVEATLENFETGKYPFGKTLYLVLPPKQSAAAEKFLAFLRSPRGAATLRETGVLPLVD